MKVTRIHIQSIDAAITLAGLALANTTNTKIVLQWSQYGLHLREIRKALFHGLSQPKFDFADASARKDRPC